LHRFGKQKPAGHGARALEGSGGKKLLPEEAAWGGVEPWGLEDVLFRKRSGLEDGGA
jgi:hypothetical protein